MYVAIVSINILLGIRLLDLHFLRRTEHYSRRETNQSEIYDMTLHQC